MSTTRLISRTSRRAGAVAAAGLFAAGLFAQTASADTPTLSVSADSPVSADAILTAQVNGASVVNQEVILNQNQGVTIQISGVVSNPVPGPAKNCPPTGQTAIVSQSLTVSVGGNSVTIIVLKDNGDGTHTQLGPTLTVSVPPNSFAFGSICLAH